MMVELHGWFKAFYEWIVITVIGALVIIGVLLFTGCERPMPDCQYESTADAEIGVLEYKETHPSIRQCFEYCKAVTLSKAYGCTQFSYSYCVELCK